MATGSVSVTNTFSNNTTADATEVNSNFTDLVNYINNRNDGTDEWQVVKVTGTVANPVVIAGNQSTTVVSIDNTATDGDPILGFKLSGTQTYSFGIDDGDSDIFKFGTTGLATNVAMQIPTGGAQVQFAAGTVGAPGIAFLGDTDSGLRLAAAGSVSLVVAGAAAFNYDADGLHSQSGYQVFGDTNSGASTPSFAFEGDGDTGIYNPAAGNIGWASQGVQVGQLDGNGAVRAGGVSSTAAAPTFTFLGDTDSGLFRVGANSVGLSIGGTSAVEIAGDEVQVRTGFRLQTIDAGTAGDPIIQRNADPNTGLFWQAADAIGFSAGGTEAVRIDASATATHTRLLVYDVDGTTLSRVTVGADDSGGAGFKVLRIPN